ncbi:E3 ubiquitin-protein ligase TRIM71-like [Anneissia japonica]|uniref:E3 ubiquitin-protein ligase TRIM71-like n=1 Tax=Anneissia japonica TaxID=1529436 RepID=UPI0014259459|nr:E3 ubiquitin-protein ligase TRIM71-like [Anneissia japonica]
MATSELNQFLENVDEKVLECTICFKRLQNPKSLSCLHSFCLACLEDWVKEKGKLTCPTCSKSYFIPDGGLQKLPPNTFLNNILETIEHFLERDQIKCICANGQAKYYCQECRHYLCSTCTYHHQKLPMLANHKLHSVENVRSMNSLQIAALQPPLCSLHNEPLKLFCCVCNIPICTDCTYTDHDAWEGNHKPISICKAFQIFKDTSPTLEKAANDCKNKLQDGLKVIIQNVTNLEQSKDISLSDIDNHVQEMVKKIKENADKLKSAVEQIYKNKKKVLEIQMDEMKITISDINTKLSFLNQLLKSDEATAMQSSESVITSLKDRINELPKIEPADDGEIHLFLNKHQIDCFQQCDIGYVSHKSAADCLELKGEESVTQGQTIIATIMKTDECEIYANQLKATWTLPTGETNITHVEKIDNGDYFVTGKCTTSGVCKLDVSADGKQIKQSPMMIKVEKEGLVNTIDINTEYVLDAVKCEDDCLLVSCRTNELLKYKQSGEYIGKVVLPQYVRVNRMYKMKNGDIAFSDTDNQCITINNINGQVIKSIGQEDLIRPFGIHVDEAANVVYVADWKCNCVFMFDIDSGQMMRKIGSPGNQEGQVGTVTDVTLTNEGNILILENENNRLQLFDKAGRFIKVLVEAGDENGKLIDPRGVVVDEDDNIIISSCHKLQLFSSDGNFIKRIDKPEDGINNLRGLSIISYYPHRLAVAKNGNKGVDIFNY